MSASPPRAATAQAKAEARRAIILEGPIGRGVLQIAAPSVATMLLQTLNGFLDRFFIGQLGPATLAAVTVCTSLLFALSSAAMAVSVGTSALVGRFVGAKSDEEAAEAIRQSLVLAFLFSVVVSGMILVVRTPLLRLLGLEGDALREAQGYLKVALPGLPAGFLMFILSGAFRGLGDTVRPLWVTLGANAVHAAFNYLLIFGNLGFPKMGLPGGAAAAVLSQVMSVFLFLGFLQRSPVAGALKGLRLPTREWTLRITRIGLPAAGQQLIRTGSMLAFQSLLAHSPAGAAAVAALGVGMVSESLAFMPGFGYSIAASAFVGQNLGAGKPDRAIRGATAAVLQAIVVMSLLGVVFYVCAAPFVHLFVQHGPHATAGQTAQIDQTMRLATDYLRVAVFSEPFLALGMVLTGALQGAGETRSPSVITACTMLGLRLPLAWLLIHAWGVHGAWIAMTVSTGVQGLAVLHTFRRGRWLKTKV